MKMRVNTDAQAPATPRKAVYTRSTSYKICPTVRSDAQRRTPKRHDANPEVETSCQYSRKTHELLLTIRYVKEDPGAVNEHYGRHLDTDINYVNVCVSIQVQSTPAGSI